MKKSVFKKSLSAFFALLMCFSALIGTGTTALAAEAGETDTVVMMSFPREGDANYDGNWGHPELHYMNGWASHASEKITAYTVGSWSGSACYCIEPSTPLHIGDVMTARDEAYWDNYPSAYNQTISADEIKLFIGRIFQYGYTGTITTEWKSQNAADADKMAHLMATQTLIWETVVGERDGNFNHVDPGSYDAVNDRVSPDHPLYSQYIAYYNSMVSSVQKHSKVPSFFAKSTAKAQEIDLEWNSSNYSATLTDTNNVLGNYTFSADTSGISFSVNGNELTITADKAPSDTVSITATKNGSVREGVIIWTDGVYVPGQGQQDLSTFAAEVNDPVRGYLNVGVSLGSAKIVKVSEDGDIAGVTFTITGEGINEKVKTNSSGEIQIDNLAPGVYTVTEQVADKYEPQEVRRVTVVSGQVATVTFENVLKRGDLTVTKNSEDGMNEGVTFHLYGTSYSGHAVDEYAVTDADGIARFSDVLIGTGYTIEEMDTDIKYVVPEDQSADILWNEVTEKSFENILKKWNVTVTKSDSENGTAQGDATLEGAEYGIYKGDQLIDTYTTDANGQFTTDYYVCDSDWTLREITPSEGYLLDEATYHIGVEAAQYTVELNSVTADVIETVLKGNISIIKHTDDGSTQIETPEEGAKFEVFLKASGSYAEAKETERDILICDENGFAQTKNLPYGVYIVHQVSGWDGRELMNDFEVFISQDGATYRYIINNRNFESYIHIVKVDAETGKNIPYAGAAFKLFDPNGEMVTMTFTYPTPTTVDTFYTDENGTLVTPEKLPYGKGYFLVEVEAPHGYVLDSEPVYFDVTEENSESAEGITIIKVNKGNTAQKGTINITKTGEVFSDVTVENEIYQPVYGETALEGAVFEIHAAEDVVTPDGTIRYTQGELVDTITTGADGIAKSKELYLGKYEVKEITAPYGYVLSDEIHVAELIYAGQEISVTETAVSAYNERQTATLSILKVLEANDLFGIGNKNEIMDVVFGLYAGEELVSTSGNAIPADGMIEIITFDEKGLATVSTDLPIGCYYVKEIATNEHYVLNSDKYEFTFEYGGQGIVSITLTVNGGAPIENELIYGSVSGVKLDEDRNRLGGAVIGLFKMDETVFSKDTALMTVVTSEEDGSFYFENIPYGAWLVREIEQPAGFVINDTVYDVVISENGQVIEIQIENKFIRGDITLTKVDAEYPDNKLTGATFEVYEDVNADGKLDDGDTLIGTLTESEAGIYEMKDMRYGHYLVRETVAPEGFILDTGVYAVFIEENGKTYAVENKAGVGFVNNAQIGSIRIEKTSEDGVVEGFTFKVEGTDICGNSYSKEFVTDANGEIHIEGIRIGSYVISEVGNEANKKYILPDDITVTVHADKTVVAQFHNKLIPESPKTGDESNLALWAALAVLSIAGIGITGFLTFKTRMKEDE